MNRQLALILDFGSQYTQLIARRLRALSVYCEIHPYHIPVSTIKDMAPMAIILSGGPAAVTQEGAPDLDPAFFELGVPVLGLCYGMQLTAQMLGGKVVRAGKKEYGLASISLEGECPVFAGLPTSQTVWMSHGYEVSELPPGFVLAASSPNCPNAAAWHPQKRTFSLQFHPEVAHTVYGEQILRNFLFNIAGFTGDWSTDNFISQAVESIEQAVGDDEVILGLSGGVDSSVAAALIHRAIGKRLHPIFVDTGLLRKNEAEQVREAFAGQPGFDARYVEAGEIFLNRLKGVDDPEQKRKIIGATFIEVFESELHRYPEARWLAQGTLYPDVIESVSVKGPSAVIKSHHNVGGLPERMNLRLLEPLRELFKDEVRAVGRALGLAPHLVERHPFPGPGLAVRIPGDITPEKVHILQEVDDIFIRSLRDNNLYHHTWQAFAVLLPVRTVGVMGDERTYSYACALRAVTSTDGMTADCADLPMDFLKNVARDIVNNVVGVNRVVFDLTGKPPATIEWE